MVYRGGDSHWYVSLCDEVLLTKNYQGTQNVQKDSECYREFKPIGYLCLQLGCHFFNNEMSAERNVCCLKSERHAFKLLLKKSDFFLSCSIAIFQEMIYGITTDKEGFHY